MSLGMNSYQTPTRVDFAVTPVEPESPTLDNVLARYRPIPAQGLFLGVADDGLPLLLNLDDPRPGPLLVLGDQHSGKTGFLQGLSNAAALSHPSDPLGFVAVTPSPAAWSSLDALPHCLGIFSPDYDDLSDLFDELSHPRGEDDRPETLLFLVDDLAALMGQKNVRSEQVKWILKNGPSQRVWPIVTLEADKTIGLADTLSAFHTRIFARIENPQLADQLTGMPGANLKSLNSKNQFCIREKNHWLRFWLPSTKEETL